MRNSLKIACGLQRNDWKRKMYFEAYFKKGTIYIFSFNFLFIGKSAIYKLLNGK